jgi:DNA repair protein RadC
MQVRNEDQPAYGGNAVKTQTEQDDAVIAQALSIMRRRMQHTSVRDAFSAPADVRQYLCLRLGDRPHEEFGVLMLDSQVRLIGAIELFRGTVNATSVYPREVAKLALVNNATSVIVYHHHPSGSLEPSRADEHITAQLKSALALIDVRLLDHVIVCGATSLSMAERGLL